MKTQVLNILQITAAQYELLVLSIYLEWCQNQTQNNKSLQKVMACPQLFNWWYRNLNIYEAFFVEEAKGFVGCIEASAAEDFYRHSTQDIHKLFSKPLIKKAYDS